MSQHDVLLSLAKILGSNEGERLNVLGDGARILISGSETAGRFGLAEIMARPGGGPPVHTHPQEEAFYVLEGEIEVFSEGGWKKVAAGGFSYAPGMVPHTYRNVSGQPARFLVYIAPDDLIEMFRKLSALAFPPDMQKVVEICREHQCEFLPPTE